MKVSVTRESVCAGDDARMYGDRKFNLDLNLPLRTFIELVLKDDFFHEIKSYSDFISVWLLKLENTNSEIACITSKNGVIDIDINSEFQFNESQNYEFRFYQDTAKTEKLNNHYKNTKNAASVQKSIDRNKSKRHT